ncbi:MAG: hypothetical protein Q8936_01675 [Bacillota bacterium]|nr:hypothetical protein [Bacillota bacterium]
MAFKNHEKYYIDLTKFAKLARWIACNSEDGPSIEDMIGPYPTYGDKSDKNEQIDEDVTEDNEINESELHWIEWAQKNGYAVQKTSKGIKVVR